MAKIKLTKTELKAQTDALKRFQRFLPMLQLKKQQLQGEIAGIVAKSEETSAKERTIRAGLDRWVGLFATDENLIAGLVKVREVKTGTANVAGVAIPTFERIDTDVKEVDVWETPAWVDDAVETTTASKIAGSKWNASDTYYTIRGKVFPGNTINSLHIENGMCIWMKK